MEERATSTRSILISLGGFIVIFLVQITAYFLTNILIILAESFMALGEILISIFLLFSVWWSKKPADELYMFGRGRAQNVAALVSAVIFISYMAVETFREAIPKFLSGVTGEDQNTTLALIVIGIATVVTAIPFINIWRQKNKDASLKAQLIGVSIELIADAAALIGISLIALGHAWADSLTSIIVALAIVFSGVFLFRENVKYLVGKSPGKDFLAKVESIARSVVGVLDVHDLKAEYVGPDMVHTGFHIEVARGTPVEKSAGIAHQVEDKIVKATGCRHCVIHVDPASE